MTFKSHLWARSTEGKVLQATFCLTAALRRRCQSPLLAVDNRAPRCRGRSSVSPVNGRMCFFLFFSFLTRTWRQRDERRVRMSLHCSRCHATLTTACVFLSLLLPCVGVGLLRPVRAVRAGGWEQRELAQGPGAAGVWARATQSAAGPLPGEFSFFVCWSCRLWR